MKIKYFTILTMSIICLWLGLWGYRKDCTLIQNIAAITGLLDMVVLEIILIADRWKYTEQCVSNADKLYKLVHKNDDYLNQILQMNFVENNVFTFTFILTSGLLMVCEVTLAAYLGWKYSSLFFVKSIGMILVFLQMFGMFYAIHCVAESFVIERKIKILSNNWLTNE